MNKELFATALIKGLGFGVTQPRLNIFYAWFGGENTEAKNNPLATTWKSSDSTFFNCIKKSGTGKCSIGVQNYPTEKTGIEYTIKTLKQDFYKAIIKAIEENKTEFDYNDPELIKAFSTWGTGYRNFLGQFAKYGKVKGVKSKSKAEEEGSKIKPIYVLGALGLVYGLYKYSKQ